MLADVFACAGEFDVLHCDVEHWPFSFAKLARAPIVTTFHGRLDYDYLPPIFEQFPKCRW